MEDEIFLFFIYFFIFLFFCGDFIFCKNGG
jgi:hypothetical protein